jgi:choice-of-anchor B domain-containing protein
MTNLHARRRAVASAILIGATCAAASAHPDDPKVRDRVPPYAGPGYARDRDGAALLGFPAAGVSLMAWLPVGQFGAHTSGSSCWGYVSPGGREYAIIGLSNGTGFVDVTNPGAPIIVGVIPALESIWRDVKVYREHAYVVTEATGGGIQVVDLSSIEAGIVTLVGTITTGGTTRTHTLALDETSGFLYRCGGESNGLRIYALEPDPSSPQLVGQWTTRYVHEAQIVTYTEGPYAGRQIAFCCSGFNGGYVETGLDILDVTDKSNIVDVGRLVYPNGVFSHQIWLSEDRTLAYLDDELDEDGSLTTTTYVFDVSNLAQPVLETTFTNGNTAIGHNLYVRGNLIFESNYRSGLRVFDAVDPLAPVEIAYFDTWETDDDASFNGLWSNFPFFPSGTVIGSDIERGLFVWRVDALRLAFDYPQGRPDLVDPAGDAVQVAIAPLAAGDLLAGSPTLHWSTGGPFQSMAMTPLGGDVYQGAFPAIECGATISWYVSAQTADGLTLTSPGAAPTTAFTATSALGTSIVIADDMETDGGWTVQSVDLIDGPWERGVPAGGGDRGDPVTDFDGSGACWVTDNADGNSDVDGGPTRLTSPVLDLSALDDPFVSYARWFSNDDNDADRLDVHLSDDGGATWTLVESVANQPGWNVHTFRVADLAEVTAQMRLRFSATDNPNNSLTEAAIDALAIYFHECGAPIPGDVDGDGFVTFGDLLAVLAAWGPCAPACPTDFDGDGVTGFLDLLVLLGNWS